jgi:hypothetical protein
MKTRMAMFVVAVMALFLLTAATTDRTTVPVKLTEAQMTTSIGGELFTCASDLVADVGNCAGTSNVNDCIESAGNSYIWCRIWETVLFIFSLIF